MKRLFMAGGAVAMAFLLSSCFTLQAFSIKKGALQPKDSTKIDDDRAPVRRHSALKQYQFALVGVDTPDDLAAQNATWGANGEFGGPKPMVVQAGLYAAIGTDCDGSALTLSALSSMTWKGYTTQNMVADKGRGLEDPR